MTHLTQQIIANKIKATYRAVVQQTPETRFPYRIVILLCTADISAIFAVLRRHLSDELAQHHCYQRSISRTLTRITVELTSSIGERAELVRLVHCLTLEKSVRTVRWESMLKKSTVASPPTALSNQHNPDSSARSPAVSNHTLAAI